MWCDDPEEPECEGETCPRWGKCGFSRELIRDDPSLRKTPIRRKKQRKTKGNK